MDLFETSPKTQRNEPLSYRMRPFTFEEYVGQSHIVGEGKLLRRALQAGRLHSLILYGPPGTGKTALGRLISDLLHLPFERINATTSNVQELRKIISLAQRRKKAGEKSTLLVIDEIHRFNKAQQDVLMPDVESGVLILVGTTTHNPFFSIVSALLSRSMVFEFKPLTDTEIITILNHALKDRKKGLGEYNVKVDPKALHHLAQLSEGDARRALNALEVGVVTTKPDHAGAIPLTVSIVEESIQKKAVLYDHDEDAHYDTISAFIKSMRGSDPDAALYWLAKMLYAGEDPRFIARRIVICASEDVGNADPQALVIATAAQQAVEFIGMPEGRIPLAQAVTYIACAPKSNASYRAIEKAMQDVKAGRVLEVPAHLKDAHYSGAKQLGHGKGYRYAHEYEGHYVHQEYKPTKARYYFPTDQGVEKKLKTYLENLEKGSSKTSSPSDPQ